MSKGNTRTAGLTFTEQQLAVLEVNHSITIDKIDIVKRLDETGNYFYDVLRQEKGPQQSMSNSVKKRFDDLENKVEALQDGDWTSDFIKRLKNTFEITK